MPPRLALRFGTRPVRIGPRAAACFTDVKMGKGTDMSNEGIGTRVLGKTGIEVSEIGLGLWAAGGHWGPVDDAASMRAIETALDAGVNFFDTADVYGDGHSELLLGKAMQGRRDQFIVATKIGWQDYDGERNRSAYTTVEKLIAGVESNLRRLNTDYIDIIQNHIFYSEPNTSVFIEGFLRLREQGKVRAYGASSSDFEFLRKFNANGQCATLQIDYSILNRTAEQDIFPYCRENHIGVIVRGGLAMGLLTGKFNADSAFPEGDFRQAWQTDPDQRQQFLEDLADVERLRKITEGRTLAQCALGFILSNPDVSVVIPGGRSARQVRENVKAGLLGALSVQERTAIDAIVPPGAGRKIWPA
jgi:aryl-alcohol dehydrogenase-like predicted oxidoreductase